MDISANFPPHTLRDYALLADGERGALVGPRGDLAWMCMPAWDSDALFSSLIGGGGMYAVTPLERYTWGGYYDERSLIWNSRWVTATGVVESREALALPSEPRTAVVLRRAQCLAGTARIRAVLDLRADFGLSAMSGSHRNERGTWTGRSGPVSFRWSGAESAHRAGAGPLVLDLELAAGETHDLVLELSHGEIHNNHFSPDSLWHATEESWQEAVPRLGEEVLGRRDAEHAVAILMGLTSRDGGMVAAATMSLPERALEGRNYDYRYAWIRDQCYAGIAAAAHANFPLLGSALRFVSERVLADGPELKPAYTVRGEAVPDERSLGHLGGYPGGADKVGNWVNRQFQLDAFGEALELFAAAASLGHLDTGQWKAVEAAAAAIEARWGDADAGIWEIDNQHWAHSRLTCVSGLRAAAAEAPSKQSRHWSALADAILADVSSDCLHSDGRWQRSPTDSRIDAALLLPAVRSALPASDPRSVATIRAVEAELVQGEYVYRFRQDDRPLGQAEGAFLLCSFLLALAKQQQGEHLAARGLFERARSACGPPGLLAEEFDVAQRQLRGNLPQAFVHALLLECSLALAGDGARLR